MVKRRVCGNKGIHDNESQKRGTVAEHAERKAPGDRGTWHALAHAMGLSRGAATEYAAMEPQPKAHSSLAREGLEEG